MSSFGILREIKSLHTNQRFLNFRIFKNNDGLLYNEVAEALEFNSMKKFFVTTPIYYVNDVPHIGHTYTTIAADVIARYYKQKGYSSRLLTGTDEHGAKIAEAAKKHSQTPKEYADKISKKFQDTWDKLNINYSRFIRTTDEDHTKTVENFLQKMYDNGAIDKEPRLYKGLYCVGHEKFMSKEELVDGLCPDHKTTPIEYAEENYYFKLSHFQKQLEELISTDQIRVRPETRKNEILGKVRQGLEDISISRANLEWGIPLPFNPKHSIYVWIDALINYYTFGQEKNIWPADLHLVGKDILWFHSVIWPAMLLSVGEKTPKEVFAHGFFSIGGQKMSKTIGNVIKPEELIKKYGVDGTRYVLLAAFPFGEDGDFSWDLFDKLYNGNLANGLGNLIARVAKLCQNNNTKEPKNNISISETVCEFIEHYKLNEALSYIWNEIADTDKLINLQKPWTLKGEELEDALKELILHVKQIAHNLQPFLPDTSKKILKQFSNQIIAQPSLFPRI